MKKVTNRLVGLKNLFCMIIPKLLYAKLHYELILSIKMMKETQE